jgi:uncharacterized protein YdeI (YjbR/CyaY-like superfamily)
MITPSPGQLLCNRVILFILEEKNNMELYFRTREEWRDWLMKNHNTSDGIWLVYYKKPSGKPRIPYNDAVEEALCFGWIDGKIKRINDDYYIQRFTPRRKGSRWSRLNVSRVTSMQKAGKMMPAGMKAFQEAVDKPELIYEINLDDNIVTPEDLLEALKKNESAFRNFNNFSLSNKRLYIFWLNSAKKEETRQRRISKIVWFSEKNRPPGMM